MQKRENASNIIRIAIAFAVIGIVGALLYGELRSDYVSVTGQGVSGAKGVKTALFIGNSHLFRHEVPSMVQQLVPPGEVPLEFEARLAAGRSLRWHETHSGVGELVATSRYDALLVQPQSQELIVAPNAAAAAGKALAAQSRGVRTYLVQTWPRHEVRDPRSYGPRWPSNMAEWDRRTRAAAVGAGLPVAPVGSAFLCVYEKTRLDLWSDDGNHASVLGAYVAALTLFNVLYARPVDVTTWHPAAIPPGTAAQLRAATAACIGQ